MTWNWPVASSQYEFWAQALTAWMAANYAFADRSGPRITTSSSDEIDFLAHQAPYRAVICGLLIFCLGGTTLNQGLSRAALALLLAAAVIVLGLGRVRLAHSRQFWVFAAEWEVGLNVLAVVLTGYAVAALELRVIEPLITFPSSKGRVAAAYSALAGTLFVGAGGTRIVRGVLSRVQALPVDASAGSNVDEPEYNRGKMIGKLERVLMLVMLGMGEYEALAFLIAAKGLIRAKDFEDRNFAEYFIIGSLMSVLVAIIVAVPLRALIIALWSL